MSRPTMDIRSWMNPPDDQTGETGDTQDEMAGKRNDRQQPPPPPPPPTTGPAAAAAAAAAGAGDWTSNEKNPEMAPRAEPSDASPPAGGAVVATEIRAALQNAATPSHQDDEPFSSGSGRIGGPGILPADGQAASHDDTTDRPQSKGAKGVGSFFLHQHQHHDDSTGPASASASASASGSALQQSGLSFQGGESDNASLNAPSTFSVGLSIDTDSSDADSAVGSVYAQSSSMSASSSIFDFVEEHGRTWHRYHEGKYFMPNDIPERERLELQHSISVRLFGGLYLAPIEHPNRVLDIGTGTGIWAIEFANEHPESDVLGTDLSPIQPEYVPPNCRFEVDDAEDEWVFSSRFDLIHARFMCGSFSNFPAIFDSCIQNLNPGGWAEFQDYYVKMQAMDDSLAGTALERWNDLVLEGVRKMGKNGLAAARFKSQMLDAGFVDVTERKYALPGNPWAKGHDQKMLGMMQMENILDGIHGMSIGLFTKMLGMSAEEVELFLVDVRKDLRNTKIHFYYIVYSVYGRRPPLQ